VNVLAAGDDHVFTRSWMEVPSSWVADVTGAEPPVGIDRLGGGLWVVQ
jgi:hypothetical protein